MSYTSYILLVQILELHSSFVVFLFFPKQRDPVQWRKETLHVISERRSWLLTLEKGQMKGVTFGEASSVSLFKRCLLHYQHTFERGGDRKTFRHQSFKNTCWKQLFLEEVTWRLECLFHFNHYGNLSRLLATQMLQLSWKCGWSSHTQRRGFTCNSRRERRIGLHLPLRKQQVQAYGMRHDKIPEK